MLVVDASAAVALLIDAGPDGDWAGQVLAGQHLIAPHLMPVEAANILRRAAARGEISADVAALAHADLLALSMDLFPYEPFAGRVWELRENLTAYDAWYVALAEKLGARLATLDGALCRASGPRCEFETPGGGTS
ncbi:MAG: type II toxin-antitoxin system VapC family toxin [Anaeromyxobacteraceae bacterium]